MIYTTFNESKWGELRIVKMLTKMERGEKLWNHFETAGNEVASLIEDKPLGLEHLTNHGVGHCYRIAQRIGDILPPEGDLNRVEIFTLLCAILYHDIGMWRHSDDEIGQYLKNKDFQRFARSDFEVMFEKIKQLRKSKDETEKVIGLFEIIRLISQYNRYVHPNRSAEILRKDARSKNTVARVIPEAVAEAAATIIEAHGWTSDDVLRSNRLHEQPVECFGYKKDVNLRYLAVLLRLGDLLDVGKDRVPEIIKQSLGKELLPLESEAHWVKEEKLRIIRIDSDMLKIEGTFDHKKESKKRLLRLHKGGEILSRKKLRIYTQYAQIPESMSKKKGLKRVQDN